MKRRARAVAGAPSRLGWPGRPVDRTCLGNDMKYRIPYAPLHVAALAVALAACQTTPPANPALESARRNVEQTRADPHVVRYAAVESEQALVALQRAQRAHTEQRDAKLTEHLAYLASQRAQVAHNVAMQRATE